LFALERSAAALETARRNAALHDVERRVVLVEGDLAEPPESWRGRMDAVVSNPPYVAASAWGDLEPEVRDHEPRDALVPGPSGMEAYHVLAPAAYDLLRPGGWLVLELGYGQRDGVRRLVDGAGLVTEAVRPDLRGIPRVLLARRP
jgi:release factor glutamine methyltransferase